MSPDLQRIFRIKEYCEEIQKTVARYGNNFEAFDADLDFQRSVAFSILQIGELGASLSESFKEATNDKIPWGAIKGMRNWMVHNYGNMSRDVIWQTIQEDIPLLLEFCKETIEE